MGIKEKSGRKTYGCLGYLLFFAVFIALYIYYPVWTNNSGVIIAKETLFFKPATELNSATDAEKAPGLSHFEKTLSLDKSHSPVSIRALYCVDKDGNSGYAAALRVVSPSGKLLILETVPVAVQRLYGKNGRLIDLRSTLAEFDIAEEGEYSISIYPFFLGEMEKKKTPLLLEIRSGAHEFSPLPVFFFWTAVLSVSAFKSGWGRALIFLFFGTKVGGKNYALKGPGAETDFHRSFSFKTRGSFASLALFLVILSAGVFFLSFLDFNLYNFFPGIAMGLMISAYSSYFIFSALGFCTKIENGTLILRKWFVVKQTIRLADLRSAGLRKVFLWKERPRNIRAGRGECLTLTSYISNKRIVFPEDIVISYKRLEELRAILRRVVEENRRLRNSRK